MVQSTTVILIARMKRMDMVVVYMQVVLNTKENGTKVYVLEKAVR